MANYKTHKSIGVGIAITSLISLVYLNKSNINLEPFYITFIQDFDISYISMLLFFAFAVVGSLLPDIDLKHSTPTKLLKRTLGSTAVILYLINIEQVSNFLSPYVEHLNIEHISLYISLGMAFIPYLLAIKIFMVSIDFTDHRGAIHSIPFAVFFSLILITLISKGGDNLMYIYNLSSISLTIDINFIILGFFIGFITHLTLDEMYSVDFRNKRIKKSFGSALTLISKNGIIAYILMYVGIAIMIDSLYL